MKDVPHEDVEKSCGEFMVSSPFGIYLKSTLTFHPFHEVVFSRNKTKNGEQIFFASKTSLGRPFLWYKKTKKMHFQHFRVPKLKIEAHFVFPNL